MKATLIPVSCSPLLSRPPIVPFSVEVNELEGAATRNDKAFANFNAAEVSLGQDSSVELGDVSGGNPPFLTLRLSGLSGLCFD